MALKARITKEQFDKLSDVVKAEYIEDGDGFKLDVEGLEDTGALRRAKERESELRKTAEQKLREAEGRLGELEGVDAKKRGDIETLERSWQSKLDAQKNEFEGRIGKLTQHTTKSLVDNVAMSIASKISTAPSLLLPHIKARLQADFEGDEPKTRVLDKDGKPSAMTVDELSAEFVANKEFSAIITGSKSTGGAGKTGSKFGGGAPKADENTDLSKMSPQQMAAHIAELKANAE